MSDKILRALMQLFAIVANSGEVTSSGRKIVDAFLRNQLSDTFAQRYLELFDGFLEQISGRNNTGEVRKKISVNSVKVLRICNDINKELDQRQKLVVLIRLLEFVNKAVHPVTEQQHEFVKTVAETFGISSADYENILVLTGEDVQSQETSGAPLLIIGPVRGAELNKRYQVLENLTGCFVFLYFHETGFLTFRYEGAETLFLNGRVIVPGTIYFFEQGSVIRGGRILPIYYNDVRQHFLGKQLAAILKFDVLDLGFSFKGNKTGLHPLTFSASSGNLIGIMGNSGSGKSTLLNLLNGSIQPSRGRVLVNSLDLHAHKNQLYGLIGNIPQDDLLIEELTVFQNLFFSAKLYFGNLNEQEIEGRVNVCLESLGLDAIKDLAVGDPLNKFISGGQRKRLNIALELIREPAILFVDEPTSGLSSSDSENVMDLLKRLTLSGKLIFVVIHQPSSNIFKLFDKLLVLDAGGYPVYYGNPVDSISYFKREMNYADPENSECTECGNINSDEIFKIIELKMVDDFGKSTELRKISSQEWYRLYCNNFKAPDGANEQAPGSETFEVPTISNKFTQYLIYLKRNVFARLNNRQYLIITLTEAPLLAFILTLALRYQAPGQAYSFGANPNIPAYFFICTIVALFFGLIASAEEIINDKKILKRESFLRLSRNSYLLSKVSYLFIISFLQAIIFNLIGHWVLSIHDLFMNAWLMFFSMSCFGNLLGLNISSGLKTRVAVYILVPFLVIPQLMLSGVMVKFEELSPWVGSQSKVPLVGNIMASRWAFEALMVNQFKDNDYEKNYFNLDRDISNATYRKDLWEPVMEEEVHKYELLTHENKADQKTLAGFQTFFVNEFESLHHEYPEIQLTDIRAISPSGNPKAFEDACNANLQQTIHYLIPYTNHALDEKAAQIANQIELLRSPENLAEFKGRYANEKVEELVKNSMVKNPILKEDNSLIRKYQPVFIRSDSKGIFSAPLYSFSKLLFGIRLGTFWFNLVIIWLMTACLYLTLYFDLIRRALELT